MAKDLNVSNEAALAKNVAEKKNSDALQKLIEAWNSKNAKAGKRVGTFGFMAATLSACGGGSGGSSDIVSGEESFSFSAVVNGATASLSGVFAALTDTGVQEVSFSTGTDVEGLVDTEAVPGTEVSLDGATEVVLQNGVTLVGDVQKFNVADGEGGLKVSGDGNVWLLIGKEDEASDYSAKLDIDLSGGDLTFDMPSDEDSLTLEDGTKINLNGGTLVVSDGRVLANAAEVQFLNIGDVVLNSELVITYDKLAEGLANGDITISGTGKLTVIVDDDAQSQVFFDALIADPSILGTTVPSIVVQNAAGTVESELDPLSLLDSKVEYLAKVLQAEIDALKDNAENGEPATLESIAGLKAAIELLNDLDTVKGSVANSIADAIGLQANENEGTATGLWADIEAVLSSVTGDIGDQISALKDDAADGEPATLDSIAGLKAAIELLNDLDTVEGSVANSIADAIGTQNTAAEGQTSNATGLWADIEAVLSSVTGDIGDQIAALKDDAADGEPATLESIAGLKAAIELLNDLDTVEGSVANSIADAIGTQNTAAEGQTSNATGLWADIEAVLSSVTGDIGDQIAALKDDAADGEPATLESIAGLKAAIELLNDLDTVEGSVANSIADAIGTQNTAAEGQTSNATGLWADIEAVLSSVTGDIGDQIAALKDDAADGEPATLESIAGLKAAIELLNDLDTVEGSVANSIADAIGTQNTAAEGQTSNATGLWADIEAVLSSVTGDIGDQIAALKDDAADGEPATLESIAGLKAAIELLNDLDTVEGSVANSIADAIGTQNTAAEGQTSNATGLWADIEAVLSSVTGDIGDQIAALKDDAADGEPATLESIAGLKAAIELLNDLDTVEGSVANSIADAIGTQNTAAEGQTSNATGLWADIEAVLSSVTGDIGDQIAALKDDAADGEPATLESIAGLKAAIELLNDLDTVEGSVANSIADAIGTQNTAAEGQTSNATGLWADIEAVLSSVTGDIGDQIAALKDDAADGEPATLESIAGLKAAIELLNDLDTVEGSVANSIADAIGTQNTAAEGQTSNATGLWADIEAVLSSVTGDIGDQIAALKDDAADGEPATLESIAGLKAAIELLNDLDTVEGSVANSIADAIGTQNTAAEGQTSNATGLWADIEAVLSSVTGDIGDQIAALKDDAADGEPATLESIAGLKAAIELLNDLDTVEGSVANSIADAIGTQNTAAEGQTSNATGLWADIEAVLSSVTGDIGDQIAALKDDAADGEPATLESIAGLKAAIELLNDLDTVEGSVANSIADAIGTQNTAAEGQTSNATGLWADIEAVLSSVTGDIGDQIAALKDDAADGEPATLESIAGLKAAIELLNDLDTVEGSVANSIADAIGTQNTAAEGQTSNATGLWADIEAVLSSVTGDIGDQIAALKDDAADGEPATLESIAGLKAAIELLNDLDTVEGSVANSIADAIGTQNTAAEGQTSNATGLWADIEAVLSSVTGDIGDQIAALKDDAADGEPATLESIAGLKAAIELLNDLDTVEGSVANSIADAIGTQNTAAEGQTSNATGLWADIEAVLSSVTGDIGDQIAALKDDAADGEPATLESIAGLKAAIELLNDLDTVEGSVANSIADAIGTQNTAAEGQTSNATGLWADIEAVLSSVTGDIGDQIAALKDDAADGEPATLESIAGLKAAIELLNDLDTVEGSVANSIADAIGTQNTAAEGQTSNATGLYALIETSIASAITDLEQKIQGEGVAEGDFTTLKALSDLIGTANTAAPGEDSNATGLYALIGGSAGSLAGEIGEPNTAAEGETSTATGLYALIETSIASAITDLEQKIQGEGVVEADFTTLKALSDLIGTENTAADGEPSNATGLYALIGGSAGSLAGEIGEPNTAGEGETSTATGLYALIETSIASAITDLEQKIQGEGVAEGDFTTLKALSDLIGTANTAAPGEDSNATGLYALIGGSAGSLAGEIGEPNTAAEGETSTATGLYALIETSIASAITDLEQKIQGEGVVEADFTTLKALSDLIGTENTAADGEPSNATGLYALIGGSAGSLAGEIGEPNTAGEGETSTATGLYALIETSIASAITDLEQKIQGEGVAEGDFTTLKALSDLIGTANTAAPGEDSNATGLYALIGGSAGSLAGEIGEPNTAAEGETSTATGLYALIETSIASAITDLEQKIQGEGVVEADFTTLKALSDLIGTENTAADGEPSNATGLYALIGGSAGSLAGEIGEPNTAGEGETSTATGLYALIETSIASAITDLEQKIQGEGVAEGDFTTLKALSDLIGTANTAAPGEDSNATGLYALIGGGADGLASDLSGLETQIADLQSQIDDIVKPDLIERNELDNRVELDEFDSEFVRVELNEGDDFINSSSAETEIVGGAGADVINLTYKDDSQDTVIYETANDGQVRAVSTVTFSDVATDYRVGSVLSLRVNDSEYSYTVTAAEGETPEQAAQGLADAIMATQRVVAPEDVVIGVLFLDSYFLDGIGYTSDAAPQPVFMSDLENGAYNIPNGMRFLKADDMPLFAVSGLFSGEDDSSDIYDAVLLLMYTLSGGTSYVPTDVAIVNPDNVSQAIGIYEGEDVVDPWPLFNLDTGYIAFSEAFLREDLSEFLASQGQTDPGVVDTILRELLFNLPGDVELSSTVVYGDDGSPTLKLTAPADKGLDVAIGEAETGVEAIVNEGLPTSYEVSFANVTWPTQTNGDNTTVFTRELSVTIDTTPDKDTDGEVTIVADVVYNKLDGSVDIAGSVANLVTAINNNSSVNTLVTAAVDDTATDKIVVTALTPPTKDTDAPTFTVGGAAVDQNGVQQETKVSFSSNDADYYEGGTLSVEIAGQTVTADMVAGDAAASVAELKAKIDGTAKYETVFEFSDDLSQKSSFDMSVDLIIDGVRVEKILSNLADVDDAISKLNAEFGDPVEFSYDAETNQVVVQSLTELSIVEGTSELVFGLPSAGSVVTTFGWTTAAAPVTTGTLMELEGSYNIAYQFVAVDDATDAVVHAALKDFSFPAGKTEGGNFYDYTQDNAKQPTVGEYITWLEGQDRVASVELASDGLSLTVTAEPGYNAQMYSTNFVTELGGEFGGTSHDETPAVPDAESTPFDTAQTSPLSLGALESVEMPDPVYKGGSGQGVSTGDGATLTFANYVSGEKLYLSYPGVSIGAGTIFSGVPSGTKVVNIDGVDYYEFASLTEYAQAFNQSLSASTSPALTGIEINVSANEETGVLTFSVTSGETTISTDSTGNYYRQPFYEPTLIFTAATEEPDPLTVKAEQSYEGEYQQATFVLEDAAQYTALTDGTDLGTSERGADVYYEGGKAYVTIAPVDDPNTADVDESVENAVTVSADMVPTMWGLVANAADLTADYVFAGDNLTSSYFKVALIEADQTTKAEEFYTQAGETTEAFLARVVSDSAYISSASFDEATGDIEVLLNAGATETVGYIALSALNTEAEIITFVNVNKPVTQFAGFEATSQALVDAINDRITGVDAVIEPDAPAIVTIEGDFATDTDIASSGSFSLSGSIDGSGFGLDFTFASAGGSITYITGEGFNVGYAGTGLGRILTFISGLTASVSSATIDENQDIVITSKGGGLDTDLTVTFDISSSDFQTALTDPDQGEDGSITKSDTGEGGLQTPAIPADLADVLESAELGEDGTITLTAKEAGKETFEISDVALDYQGVKQLATISLEDADQYTALTDGTDLGTSGRGADVYFEGGKVWVEITPFVGGQAGTPVVVSANMKETYSNSVEISSSATSDGDFVDITASARIGTDNNEPFTFTLSVGNIDYTQDNFVSYLSALDPAKTIWNSDLALGDNQSTVQDFLDWINSLTDVSAELVDPDTSGDNNQGDSAIVITNDTGGDVSIELGSTVRYNNNGKAWNFKPLDTTAPTTKLAPELIADAIQAEIDGGELDGVLGSVSVDGTTITLEAAEADKEVFDVSDVRLDYAGVKQIAEVDFTALDDGSATSITYFDNPADPGKLAVTLKEVLSDGSQGEAITISADMADGEDDGTDVDEAGTLAALVEAIQASIDGSDTAATASVGVVADALTVNTEVATGEGSGDIDQFGLEFFIDDNGTVTSFTAVARQTDHFYVHFFLNGKDLAYASNYSGAYVSSAYVNGSVTLDSFLTFFNGIGAISDAGVSLSLTDDQIVISSDEVGQDIEVGIKVINDELGVIATDTNTAEGSNGFFTGAGTSSLAGIVSSVSEENGVITLTSADNVKQQFTVTAATASDPAKVEVTEVSFSTTDSDYFATGSDANSTVGKVSIDVGEDGEANFQTFSADMVEGDALATAKALLAEMEATEGGLDSTFASVKLDLSFGDFVDHEGLTDPTFADLLGEGLAAELETNLSVSEGQLEATIDVDGEAGFDVALEEFGSFTVAEIELAFDGVSAKTPYLSLEAYTRIEDWAADAQAHYREIVDPSLVISYNPTSGVLTFASDKTINTNSSTGLTLEFAERELTDAKFVFTGAEVNEDLNISASASVDAVTQVTKITFPQAIGDDAFIGGIGRDVSVEIAGETFTIDGSTRLELLQDLEAQLKDAIIADAEGTGEGISAVLAADGISIDEGDGSTGPSMTLTARYGGVDPLDVSTLTRAQADLSEGNPVNVYQELQVGFTTSYLNSLEGSGKTLTLDLGQVSASYEVKSGDTATDIVAGLADALSTADPTLLESASVNSDDNRTIDIKAAYPGPNVLGTVSIGQENTVKLTETNGSTVEVTTGFFAEQIVEGVIDLDETDQRTVGNVADETEGSDLNAADANAVEVNTTQTAKAQTDEDVDYTNPGTGEGADATFYGDADQGTLEGVILPSSGDYSFAELTATAPNVDNPTGSNYGGFTITNDLTTDGVITHTFDFSVFDGSSYEITDTANAFQVMRAFERSLSLESITDLNADTQAANGDLESSSPNSQFLILLTDSDTGNSYLWSAATAGNGVFSGSQATLVETFEGYTPTKLAGVTVTQTHTNPDSGYSAIDNSPQFDEADSGEGNSEFFGDAAISSSVDTVTGELQQASFTAIDGGVSVSLSETTALNTTNGAGYNVDVYVEIGDVVYDKLIQSNQGSYDGVETFATVGDLLNDLNTAFRGVAQFELGEVATGIDGILVKTLASETISGDGTADPYIRIAVPDVTDGANPYLSTYTDPSPIGDGTFGSGDLIVDGIDQTVTNPDNSYTADDNSPQFNDAGAGEGNGELFGSDEGYYNDEGLWTSYLNGGTLADPAKDDGEGNDLYDQLDGEDLDPLDIGDGSAVDDGGVSGENAGSEDLVGEDIDGVDGFAPFDWDDSDLTIISEVSTGADVIDNFQVGTDDEVTFTWTGDGGYTAVGRFTYDVEAAGTSVVGVDGGEDNYGIIDMDVSFYDAEGALLGTYDQVVDNGDGILDFRDVTYEYLNFGYDTETGDFVRDLGFGVGYDDVLNGGDALFLSGPSKAQEGDLLLYSVSSGEDSILDASPSFSDDFDFEQVNAEEQGDFIALEGELAESTLYDDPTDMFDGIEAIATGNMLLRGSLGNGFDLSENEFGLVSSAANFDVDATDIANADAVAELLNNVFDFAEVADGSFVLVPGTTDNGEINTSIFAVTASDDATSTAIWAHTQSSSGDDTVEAEELALLTTVNTTGGEFSSDNFAISDGTSFQQPILQAQDLIA